MRNRRKGGGKGEERERGWRRKKERRGRETPAEEGDKRRGRLKKRGGRETERGRRRRKRRGRGGEEVGRKSWLEAHTSHMNQGFSSVVEPLPSNWKAQGLVLSSEKNK